VRTYIIVMEGVAALLLVGVAGRLAVTGWRGPRGAFRVATVGASAAFALFGVTSIGHMLHVAGRDELVSSGWDDMLLGPLAATRATAVVVVTATVIVIGLRHWAILGRSQTMVDVLTERLPSEGHDRQAELSSREHEILDLISRGILSDAEIAEALHISPATAATHVQRILKKTELHNRRDLMLLTSRRH
jgi:DNA-binding CsgD family transcriptional regulator